MKAGYLPIIVAFLIYIPAFARPSEAEKLPLTVHFSESERSGKKSGLHAFGTAGDPEVYGKLLHIAIPRGSGITLRIDGFDAIRSAGKPGVFGNAHLDIRRFSRVYPKSPVWISEPKRFRQVEYVDVFVFPVQYDLRRGRKISRRTVSFELEFDRPAGTRIEEQDSIARLNDRFFYNEWRYKGGEAPAAIRTPSTTWQPPSHTGTVYKVQVRQDGIYKLDTAFLSANTDWNIASVDPRRLRLFNLGGEIPVTVIGESDGALDPGDALLFYGRAFTGENDPGVWQSGDFTDENVYWLIEGTVNGLRMSSRDATPLSGFAMPVEFTSTEHFESNPVHLPFQNQPDTDLWLWKNALWVGSDSSQAVQHHNVTLPSVSSTGTNASLKFVCRSRSYDTGVNPDHHVIVKLNGSTLGDFTMNDYEVKEPVYNFSHGLFGGSGNRAIDLTHEVTNPVLLGTTVDAVQSNWFEITYSRQFVAYNDRLFFHYGAGSHQFDIPGYTSSTISVMDITSTSNPVLLTGGQITGAGPFQISFQDVIAGNGNDYLAAPPSAPSPADFVADVPSNLAGISVDTSWILIAPDAWTGDAAVQNLNNLRQSQGLNPLVVSVTDIFDEYNYGIFSPYAIKDFLESVYNLATPANLQYVVLLGDADYDYKDYAGNGNFNLVPTYMVADPGLGSAFHPYAMHSFDNYFGSYDGDSVPEVFIGRIPVRTLTQAQNAVNRIIAYENVVDHSWLGDNLFTADCQDAASFEAQQEINSSFLPANGTYTSNKMYFRLSDPTPPGNCTLKPVVPSVVDALNAGHVITSWLGHGGFQQWGVPGYLHSNDVPSLTNAARPTVMLNANCFTGAFYHAATSALMEDLMAGSNGIVSGFGPGTYMFIFQAGPATEPFYSDVYGKDKERVLGALYQHLYMNLANDERILQGMAALGDPASRLPIPAAEAPQDFQIAAVDCSGPAFSWDPPAVGSVSGYNIYRATSATGPFSLLNASLLTETTFTDFTAVNGITYHYYVAAIDSELFEGKGSGLLSFTPGGVPLTITPATLPDGVDGTPYNQLLTGNGGTGPYSFSIAAGALPTGVDLDADGTLSGIPSGTGVFNFTILVTDPTGCSTQQFALTINASCLFCDDFENGDLASDWTYNKPVWSEALGKLTATTTKKATAIADPVFAGCSVCDLEASLQTAGGNGNQIRLYGWYQTKSDTVELLFKQEKNRLILKQRSGGPVVAKTKATFTIVPGVEYNVRIEFDGADFNVYIDDNLLLTLTKAPGSNPSGTVGFFVKATTGSFGHITVN